MARMRTIKPDAATSETLAQVAPGIRWTFGMFWTHCDDEGRAVWNLRLIKAAIYPLDDDKTPAVLDDEFKQLEHIGAVCRYEVGGKEYVHVPAWSEHQHPNRRLDSKLPPCPRNDHSVQAHVRLTEPTVHRHEPLTSVVVEEGHVEVGETGRESAATDLALVNDAPTAQTIVGEWLERAPKRPPQQVVGQVAKLTGQMLGEGIDPDDVRRGLAAWMSKGLHPSTLPSMVNEVMNTPVSNGVGRATSKAAGWLALDAGGVA